MSVNSQRWKNISYIYTHVKKVYVHRLHCNHLTSDKPHLFSMFTLWFLQARRWWDAGISFAISMWTCVRCAFATRRFGWSYHLRVSRKTRMFWAQWSIVLETSFVTGHMTQGPYTWYSQQPCFIGCFSWMIPNIYIKKCKFHQTSIRIWLFRVPDTYLGKCSCSGMARSRASAPTWASQKSGRMRTLMSIFPPRLTDGCFGMEKLGRKMRLSKWSTRKRRWKSSKAVGPFVAFGAATTTWEWRWRSVILLWRWPLLRKAGQGPPPPCRGKGQIITTSHNLGPLMVV